VQNLIRRSVKDASAGLRLHFLHINEGPFSYDAGNIVTLACPEYLHLVALVAVL